MRCPFVEVRQAKQDSRRCQSRNAPHAPLEQILHPSSEEEFFRNCDKKEGQNKAANSLQWPWPNRMQVQKPKPESKQQSNRNVENKLAQPHTNVAQAQPQVEADSSQLTDHEKPIDARIQQQHFVEDSHPRWPRRFEPPQVDRQPQRCQHNKVTPVSVLLRVQLPRMLQ